MRQSLVRRMKRALFHRAPDDRGAGVCRKIWTLTDEKIEQETTGKSYFSRQMLQQYDCEEETFHFLPTRSRTWSSHR